MKLIFFPLFLILFFVSGAFAQTAVTMYVRTDCANNGDGTDSGCAASIGAAGANTTLGNAHAKAKTNYASGLAVANVLMTIDCAGATLDASEPTIDILTDATRFVHLYVAPANRHSGVWSTSKYRLVGGAVGLRDRTFKLKVTGLQFGNTIAGTGNQGGLVNHYTGDAVILDAQNSIFTAVSCNTAGGGACAPVFFQPQVAVTATQITFINNVVYISGATNSGGAILRGSNSEITIIYGNSIYGGSAANTALVVDCNGTATSVYLKDNAIYNPNGGQAYRNSGVCSTFVTANNITNDTSSPNVAFRSKICSVVSTTAGSENFSLQAGDTNCKDTGANLSADAQFPFSTDINGTTRPQGAAWDIGAFEYIAAVLNGSLTTLKVSGAL